jgi:hypothetical protein
VTIYAAINRRHDDEDRLGAVVSRVGGELKHLVGVLPTRQAIRRWLEMPLADVISARRRIPVLLEDRFEPVGSRSKARELTL